MLFAVIGTVSAKDKAPAFTGEPYKVIATATLSSGTYESNKGVIVRGNIFADYNEYLLNHDTVATLISEETALDIDRLMVTMTQYSFNGKGKKYQGNLILFIEEDGVQYVLGSVGGWFEAFNTSLPKKSFIAQTTVEALKDFRENSQLHGGTIVIKNK
jgi:hypothetical protein